MTEGTKDGRLRVVVATPLEDELAQMIVEREPRIDLVLDQSLLPPMRHPGDHEGDPAFSRSDDEQKRFDELVDSAEALYGIPDTDPSALARTVRANPRLRWVHTMAAGGGGQVKAAGLSDEELERVLWTKSAGPHAATLAEFALFGVLAGAKDLPRLQAHQRRHEWADRWAMRQVFEMTVLVAGLGHIGRATAERFHALGATVVGVNKTQRDLPYVDRNYTPDQFVEAAQGVDAIVSTLPGTDATIGLVDREVLGAAAPGVIVVNVGRGSVIDEDALIEALQGGQVGFAALDVVSREPLDADSPLWDMENVLVSPHTAALNPAEDRLIAELFAENATRFLDGEPVLNEIDRRSFY